MNVLSLFDGCSCGQLALQRAGIKVNNYYASEIDKYAIQVTMKNFPNTIQLGDVRNIKASDLPKIDLLIGGSPCFPKGTMVVSIDGPKDISEIQSGDYVLTHKGRFMKVLATGGKKDTPTRQIRAKGFNPISTTDEHPFFTKKKIGRTYDSPKWIEASSLSKGDLIGIPIVNDIQNELWDLSDEELFVLGRYVADGHTRKDMRKGRNTRYYQMILSIGNEKFFKTSLAHSLYKHTKNVHRMVFSNKKLTRIAEKYCGCGAINKYIHPYFLALPKDRLKIFLDGIMSGDGSYRGTEKRLTTVSKDLAESLQLVLVKCFGCIGSIQYSVRKPKTIIEGREVNQRNTFNVSFRENTSKTIVEDGVAWTYVKSNTLTGNAEDVYNLEVATDNSYLANNAIVHNCQGFSSSGKMLNFDDPRSALFFEYVRILKELREINPDIKFLLENVKMKKEWVAVISEILGVEAIEINSALASAQNRKRLYWANFPISQPKDRAIFLKDILEEGDTVAGMRGRYLNPDGTRDDINRPKIIQVIENRVDGKSNTLTTVSKDNLVFVGHTGKNKWSEGSTIRAFRQGERIFAVNGKNPTLSAQMGGSAKGGGLITEDLLHYRNLTVIECERLQTMPDNYTEGVSNSQRYKMIGNGWTIEVIKEIFQNLLTNPG